MYEIGSYSTVIPTENDSGHILGSPDMHLLCSLALALQICPHQPPHQGQVNFLLNLLLRRCGRGATAEIPGEFGILSNSEEVCLPHDPGKVVEPSEASWHSSSWGQVLHLQIEEFFPARNSMPAIIFACLQARRAELPFCIHVLPDFYELVVHHGDQDIDMQDANDPLVHCPETQSHRMSKLL